MKWLVVSVVLTVLLNVAIRRWPGAAQRGTERLTGWAEGQRGSGTGSRPVRVMAPWKVMLIVSVALTVLLNIVIRVI